MNLLSLGLFTHDIKFLSKLTSIPFSSLKPYTIEEPGPKNKLFMCDQQYGPVDPQSSIIINDILLTINGEKIGGDLIKMTSLLKKGEPASVEIYRSDQKMTLSLMPHTITQAFCEFIDVDGLEVRQTSSLRALGSGYPVKSPREIPEKGCETSFITHVKDIRTPTFHDFVVALYDVVENQQKNYFYIRKVGEESKREYYSAQDLSQWRGKTFYVIHFDKNTHQWKQTDYKDYVRLLKEKG